MGDPHMDALSLEDSDDDCKYEEVVIRCELSTALSPVGIPCPTPPHSTT